MVVYSYSPNGITNAIYFDSKRILSVLGRLYRLAQFETIRNDLCVFCLFGFVRIHSVIHSAFTQNIAFYHSFIHFFVSRFICENTSFY